MDEAVEPIGYLTISHNNHTHTTYAGTFIICRLEVYCCKIIHTFFVTQTKVRQKSDIQNSFFRYNFLSLKPQQQNRPISVTISTCKS
jgi:hypothetical protein